MGTKPEWTPGPWEVFDMAPEDIDWDSRFEVWAGEPNENALDDKGIPCAGLITSHVKGQANATLIAAAPALYEALEKIIEMNVQYAIDKYGDASKAENMACVRVARAALLLARGEGEEG